MRNSKAGLTQVCPRAENFGFGRFFALYSKLRPVKLSNIHRVKSELCLRTQEHVTIDRLSPPLCLPAGCGSSLLGDLSPSLLLLSPHLHQRQLAQHALRLPAQVRAVACSQGRREGGLRLTFSRLPAPHGVIAYPAPRNALFW